MYPTYTYRYNEVKYPGLESYIALRDRHSPKMPLERPSLRPEPIPKPMPRLMPRPDPKRHIHSSNAALPTESPPTNQLTSLELPGAHPVRG